MAPRAQKRRLRLVDTEPSPRASDPGVGVEALAAQDVIPTPLPSMAVRRASFDDLPDAQLVALGCKGDTRALERLYRRHASFAIHLAARIEGSSRDVEDIAHDAFIRAFERLNDLTDPAAFRAWLGAIVVHKVRSRMRRARLMALLGMGKAADPVDLDALASPDASPHTRAQIAQIYALLRTLATDDRIAWTLRAVEGHDLETVARLTRCSLATVKRRISRAQKFLDEHFVDAVSMGPQAAPNPASPREAEGRSRASFPSLASPIDPHEDPS
jgi:RNA polymerase sigma-70 factor, ECF subfamily